MVYSPRNLPYRLLYRSSMKTFRFMWTRSCFGNRSLKHLSSLEWMRRDNIYQHSVARQWFYEFPDKNSVPLATPKKDEGSELVCEVMTTETE
jgi:hypothetical protein